jgi:putative transposase
MPWNQTSPMDQRTQFIADYLRQTFSITELCQHYQVSRKTGYKWIDRYLTQGPVGLDERSRRPRNYPRETPPHVVEALLEARRRHPSWGAKKLLTIASKQHPDWPWPHRATIYDILNRHGLRKYGSDWNFIENEGKPRSLTSVLLVF